MPTSLTAILAAIMHLVRYLQNMNKISELLDYVGVYYVNQKLASS